MKQTVYGTLLVSLIFLLSCKSKEKASVPLATMPTDNWVRKDLSKISSHTPIEVALPKTATLEKNPNGGVDVKINDTYMLTISSLAVVDKKEAMESDKSYTIQNSSYKNARLLIDEENGFVYTYQMNDEENGTTYQPEAHFIYYLEKEGAVYSIKDDRPLDNFFVPGSVYSDELARKMYSAIKQSAKVK